MCSVIALAVARRFVILNEVAFFRSASLSIAVVDVVVDLVHVTLFGAEYLFMVWETVLEIFCFADVQGVASSVFQPDEDVVATAGRYVVWKALFLVLVGFS